MNSWCSIPIASAVLALAASPAAAQITGEPVEGRTRNHVSAGSGNVFGCPTAGNAGSPPCGDATKSIKYRLYSQDPASSGKINAVADGNPIFLTTANGSYLSDVDNSANYFGQLHAANLPMNLVWDAQLRGGTGDHAGYYAAQSQLMTDNGETGDTSRADCAGTRGIACFSVANGLNQDDPRYTPQGIIVREGGLRGIPVPTVESWAAPYFHLRWIDATNEYVNDGAPRPILGLNLYLRTSTSYDALDSRSVSDADLDASATFHAFVPKGSTKTTIDCRTLPAGTVSFIPVFKVRYLPNDAVGEMESRYWSANGTTIACSQPLLTEVVNFRAVDLGAVRGRRTAEVSWETTTEDGTIGFDLQRAVALDGPFETAVRIAARGKGGEGALYAYDDVFRAPGSAREVFYRLLVIESEGTDLSVGPIRLRLERERGGGPRP